MTGCDGLQWTTANLRARGGGYRMDGWMDGWKSVDGNMQTAYLALCLQPPAKMHRLSFQLELMSCCAFYLFGRGQKQRGRKT